MISLIHSLDNLTTGIIQSKQLMDLNVSSHCWICEGWSKLEFNIGKDKVIKAVQGKVKRPQVNLHLNFDSYKPLKMVDCGDSYKTFRMIPPGRLEYFYTIGDVHDNIITDDVSPTRNRDTTISLGTQTLQVKKLNYLEDELDIS